MRVEIHFKWSHLWFFFSLPTSWMLPLFWMWTLFSKTRICPCTFHLQKNSDELKTIVNSLVDYNEWNIIPVCTLKWWLWWFWKIEKNIGCASFYENNFALGLMLQFIFRKYDSEKSKWLSFLRKINWKFFKK